MTLALPAAAIVFFSLLGYWGKTGPLPFMLAAGCSLAVGFQWYDVYTTDFGLTVSMMFIAYTWVCIMLAFKALFWGGKRED